MKYLGIDYGQKRIGLSVSDGLGCLAFPLQTLLKTTREAMFAQLVQIITKQEITHIVLGLPKNPDAEGVDLTARQVHNFAASLERRCNLPISLTNEAYSSHEANQDLQARGLNPKQRKEVLDQQSAVRILQGFLDQQVANRAAAQVASQSANY